MAFFEESNYSLISRSFGIEYGPLTLSVLKDLLPLTCFRFYYLNQGPRLGSINEETLIKVLYWICPLSASLLTTCTIAENFLFKSDNPMMFFYEKARSRFQESRTVSGRLSDNKAVKDGSCNSSKARFKSLLRELRHGSPMGRVLTAEEFLSRRSRTNSRTL